MFEIQPNEKSDQAVRRVIREEIEASAARLVDPAVSPDEAVHDTRKSLKRIRAALRLVRNELGEEMFARENAFFRDAAYQLAPLRDSVVMIETLELVRLQYVNSLNPAAFENIHQKLVELKDDTRRRFLEQTDLFPAVSRQLAQAGERLRELPIHEGGFQNFRQGLRRVYRSGRLRMELAYREDTPEAFHDWRKRVKYLWHHIEFFSPLWPAIFEPLAEELHRLSDFLGEAHDSAVLAGHLEANYAAASADPDLALLLDLLAKHRQALELAAYPLGRRLYAEKPAAFVARIEAYWDIIGERSVMM